MTRTFNHSAEPEYNEPSQMHDDQTGEPLEELFKKPKRLFTVGLAHSNWINRISVRNVVMNIIKSCKTKNVVLSSGNAPGRLFAYETDDYIEFICTEDERKKIQNLVNNMSVSTLRSLATLPLKDQGLKDELKKIIMWSHGRSVNEAFEDDELWQVEGQDQSEEPEQLEEIFGLGKKKRRYFLGLYNDHSSTIDWYKLIPAIKSILTKNAENVAGWSEGMLPKNVRYQIQLGEANASIHGVFGFTCTEDTYKSIQNQVSNISPKSVSHDTAKHTLDKAAFNRLLVWVQDLNRTAESIEEAADNWYKQEW